MKLDITIGKYTLESLTNGMYASPLDLYREYIQNAVDSFDDESYLDNKKSKIIKISLNYKEKSILIEDNGKGISKDNAVKTLLDIGNSQKNREFSRGFRGIGRLAGLGYCSKLTFTTSAKGESNKTIITFDSEKLKELLLSTNSENESVEDVLNRIVSVKVLKEKNSVSYFTVLLENIDMADKLANREIVKKYLIQTAPLKFSSDFKWSSIVKNKIKNYNYDISGYEIILSCDGEDENLYKPYNNLIVSDRVKKIEEYIKDIKVIPFYKGDLMSAIMWYAESDFNGTIVDSNLKGIRVRKGNILIGSSSTVNQFFKEERFNGWLIGEIHLLDNDLIINSRRDDLEKNEAYYDFFDSLSNWSNGISKEIRKKSYERNLTNTKIELIEAESFDDVNGLGTEELELDSMVNESMSISMSDSQFVAENDFYDKLSIILNKKKTQTKYTALNINEKITLEQKAVLERVFDLIAKEYDDNEAEKFIDIIASNY